MADRGSGARRLRSGAVAAVAATLLAAPAQFADTSTPCKPKADR